MKKDKTVNISYILAGIDSENKWSLFCHNLKTNIKHMIPYQIRDFYHKHVRTIWRPQHSRIRKVIPKYWYDLDYILLQVNFEIIKSFYEDEYTDGPIDWNADERHQKFAEWLEAAYGYIKWTRPQLEAEVEAAYPKAGERFGIEKASYKELYGEVDRLEKHIHKMDTKVLTELINNRDFLWT